MFNNSVSTRFVSVITSALVLVGCNATDYSKPIATFAEATTAAESALSNLNKTATDEYTDFLSQRARSNVAYPVVPGSTISSGCSISEA